MSLPNPIIHCCLPFTFFCKPAAEPLNSASTPRQLPAFCTPSTTNNLVIPSFKKPGPAVQDSLTLPFINLTHRSHRNWQPSAAEILTPKPLPPFGRSELHPQVDKSNWSRVFPSTSTSLDQLHILSHQLATSSSSIVAFPFTIIIHRPSKPSNDHQHSEPDMSQLPPISSLMSPPEAKPIDSFSSPLQQRQTAPSKSILPSYTPENTLPPMTSVRTPESKALRVLPSPPISPWTGAQYKVDRSGVKATSPLREEETSRDPILFPGPDRSDGTAITEPLFPLTPERLAAEEIVTQHMACHLQQFDNKKCRPTREEYLLALSCVASIGQDYNRNPALYMKRAREEMDEHYYKAKRICARPGFTNVPAVKIAPAPSRGARQPKKAVPAVKQTKVQTQTQTQPSTPKAKPPFKRVSRKAKASPLGADLGTPNLGRLGTPDATTPVNKRDPDIDYHSLPDYCPPALTLGQNAKALKVEWTSNHLDLTNDPDRHMLHEAEITAASVLRLSCAMYLCSKRRIFEARLRAFNNKKEFRKTDAQQACKIDVNKASKLWTAFDKVGWLDKAYLERFL